MYLGTASQARGDFEYEVWAQLGLNHITGYPPYKLVGLDNRPAGLRTARRSTRTASKLDMVRMPMTPYSIDSEVARSGTPHIMLGKSPASATASLISSAKSCACAPEVGIRGVQYNMNFLGILRTEETIGRGGSRNATFQVGGRRQGRPDHVGRHGAGGRILGTAGLFPRTRHARGRISTASRWPAIPTTPTRRRATWVSTGC